MTDFGLLWNRVPVILRATLMGAAASTAGTLPWAFLVSANLEYWPTVPWAVPPMALYLWFYWRYVRGAGWPRSTAKSRRETSRANSLSNEVWGMALFAGALGLGTVVLFQNVMNRLVVLPQQQDIDPSRYPLWTALLWILMSAIVSGVVEEASFRGFMQRTIERRYGPIVAILLTGLLFGFAHFTHPEVTLVLLPYYLAVAAVYGTLAYLTDSILPSMVLHAGGNAFGAMDLFSRGHSEWQASPQPLIWQSGPDLSFWALLVVTIAAAAVTVRTFEALAKKARDAGALQTRHWQ